MTEDALLDDIVFPRLSETNDKLEKAFKQIRDKAGEKFEPETNFDFGGDDFGWM